MNRAVYRYAQSATAGYAVTRPLANWVGQQLAQLAQIIKFCVICAISSLLVWVDNGDPTFLIACVCFVCAALLAGIILYFATKRIFLP